MCLLLTKCLTNCLYELWNGFCCLATMWVGFLEKSFGFLIYMGDWVNFRKKGFLAFWNVFGICGCDCGVKYKFLQVIWACVFCLPSVWQIVYMSYEMDFVVWQPCELVFLRNHLSFWFIWEIGLILGKMFPCILKCLWHMWLWSWC